jgi:hypothetical protein
MNKKQIEKLSILISQYSDIKADDLYFLLLLQTEKEQKE